MNILSIDKLWKKTETNFELKDVSLAIYEDEWLLITGPVHQGKEVLQQILLGFDDEWDGTICLHGKNIKNIQNYSEQIAFVHNYFLKAEIDEYVYDYLAIPLRLMGLKEKEVSKRVHSILEKTTYNINLQAFVKDLSLQGKVVIELLRAILTTPKLLIIEEPFHELPNSKRNMVLSLFKEFKKLFKMCPIVIFSSYTREWLDICDRIIIMNNQSIVQQGRKNELLQKPENVFVSRYIDSEGFSYLKGKINGGTFSSKGLTFTFPNKFLINLQYYEGQTIYIGMKASRYQLIDKPSKEDWISLLVPIHLVKEEKDHHKIYSNIGGQPLVAQIKNSVKINKSKQMLLHYPFIYLLIFDGVTEIILKRRG